VALGTVVIGFESFGPWDVMQKQCGFFVLSVMNICARGRSQLNKLSAWVWRRARFGQGLTCAPLLSAIAPFSPFDLPTACGDS